MTSDEKTDYFDVLIPDLIKDVARQAVSGNEQSRQRLEVIAKYTTDVVEQIKNKPKPFFKPRPSPSRGYAQSKQDVPQGMKPKRQS